jgi:hypothetical protein
VKLPRAHRRLWILSGALLALAAGAGVRCVLTPTVALPARPGAQPPMVGVHFQPKSPQYRVTLTPSPDEAAAAPSATRTPAAPGSPTPTPTPAAAGSAAPDSARA